MNYPELPADDPLLEPGAYDGASKPWVRPDDYHRSARLSRSQMMKLWPETGTPAEFQWMRNNPTPTTAAMVRGDAIHAMAMEPKRFAEEYAFPPPGLNRTRKVDKAAFVAFMTEHGWDYDESASTQFSPGPQAIRIVGFTPEGAKGGKLFYDDVKAVKETVAALHADKDLSRILQSQGLTEATYCWDEPPHDDSGIVLPMRIRPDRVNFTPLLMYS